MRHGLSRRASVIGLATLAVVAAALFVGAAPTPAPTSNPVASPVALIELFTSEGCSSCPPGDEVFSQLVPPDGAHEGVYALAFHVDYWDRLGWPDRFASKEWTDRQKAYSREFRLPTNYTPQMVVNGREQFVAVDKARAQQVIDKALASPAAVALAATVKSGERGSLVVDVSARGAPSGAVVWVALTESGLTTDVKRGENAGRRLHHDHVVRTLARAELDARGAARASLAMPRDANRAACRVVVWATEAGKPAVLGACAVAVPE